MSKIFSQFRYLKILRFMRRRIPFAVFILLCVYTVICCADTLADKLLFHPEKYIRDLSTESRQEIQFQNSKKINLTGCWLPYESNESTENIEQNHTAADTILSDVTLSDTILYCHGNGENISQCIAFAEQIRKDFQCSVLIFDYEGYGKSEGKATAAGILDDGLAAFEYLTKHKNIPESRIILWGFSLGGSVAADIASKYKVKALIIQSSFTSLGDMGEHLLPFIPVKLLLREQLNSEKKMAEIHCPVFISHGRADKVIPFEQGKKLFEKANEPKQFYETQEGSNEHNSPLTQQHIDKLRQYINGCSVADGKEK